MYDYSSIDLSNQKDAAMEDSSQKRRIKASDRGREVDKYGRVYNFEDQRYRYADEEQQLESRDYEESDRARQERAMKKGHGYLVKKHMKTDSQVEYEEVVEPRELYVRNRDTQTPVRETENEGIQCESSEIKAAKSTFRSQKHKKEASDEEKSIKAKEEEKIPFSTIRKRDITDSESERQLLEVTPIKDMDYDEIVSMIKDNEKLQKKIINDPSLREKLYEKFSGMRHSSSDQTLPHSFWSARHGERRTQGDTNIFVTPMRPGEEDKEEYHRFTQFAHSEMIGREGTIYDEGTGVRRPDYAEYQSQEGTRYPERITGKTTKKQQPLSKEERKSFSFKDQHKVKSQKNVPEKLSQYSRQKYSNTVEVDENRNELLTEGEENIESRFSHDEEMEHVPSSESKKEHIKRLIESGRSSQIRDISRRTSQYKRKYQKSPSTFDTKSGKRVFAPRANIDIRHNKNQLLAGDEGEEGFDSQLSREGEGEPSQRSSKGYDTSSYKKQAKKALIKRYKESEVTGKTPSKPKPYSETTETPKAKGKDKYLSKKEEEGEGDILERSHSSEEAYYEEEEKLRPGQKLSKSKAISYTEPKYTSERLSQSLRKAKAAAGRIEGREHVQYPDLESREGRRSDELQEEDFERISDEREAEVPHQPQAYKGKQGRVSESYKKYKAESEKKQPKKFKKEIAKEGAKTFREKEHEEAEKLAATGTKGEGAKEATMKHTRSVEEPEGGLQKHEEMHRMYPYQESRREGVEYYHDDYAQHPRDYSDYHHSIKDIHSQKHIERLEEGQSRGTRSQGILKARDARSPLTEAKGLPMDTQFSAFKQRKKSKYRETKEQLKDKKKSRSSFEPEFKPHTKSVEVDLSDRESIEERKVQDKYGRFLTQEHEGEDEYSQPSERESQKSLRDYKPLEPREYEEGKKIEYQRRYGDKAKSEKKQRKGLPKAGGDFEGESDEEYVLEDENLREQEPHQEVLKSTKKKTPKAQDEKYRVSKEYQPSTKKYDLKQRMKQDKAQKPGYEEEEGEEELEEPYSREAEKSKGKIGKKYSHVSMEGESGQTPTKSYDISKKQKGKQPAHAHHVKSSTSLKKKALQQSSEEGEGYSSRSGQELRSQPSSESAKKLRKEERKKAQLSSTTSPSKQKQIKADISDKKKLSHESLKKLGKKQESKKSSDHSSEESGDKQIPQEYRKKYDIKEAVEKAAIQRVKGQREPDEFEEEGKHPSKGVSQKYEGEHPSEISKESTPGKKAKPSKKPSKKPSGKSRQSQMESYKAKEEIESPPLVPGDEAAHHDVAGYEERTKQKLVEHPDYEEGRYSPEAEEGKYGKTAKDKPYATGEKKCKPSRSEQKLHGRSTPEEFEEEGKHAPSAGQMKKYKSSEELEKPFSKIRSKEAEHIEPEEFEEGDQRLPAKEAQRKRSKEQAETDKETKGAKGKRRPLADEYEQFEGHVEKPEELEERLYEPEEPVSGYTEEEKQDMELKDKDRLTIPRDAAVQQPYEHEVEPKVRLPEGVLPEYEDMHEAQREAMRDTSKLAGREITPEQEQLQKLQREAMGHGYEETEEGRQGRARPEAQSIGEAYQQPIAGEEGHRFVKDISRRPGELLEEGKSPSKRMQEQSSGKVPPKYEPEGEEEYEGPSKIQQMRPGYKPSEFEEEQAHSSIREKYERQERPTVSEEELKSRRLQGASVGEEFDEEGQRQPQRSRDELAGKEGMALEEQKLIKTGGVKSRRDQIEEERRRKEAEAEMEEFQYSPESKTTPSGKLTERFGEREEEEFEEEAERLSDVRREAAEGRRKSGEEEKQQVMAKGERKGKREGELSLEQQHAQEVEEAKREGRSGEDRQKLPSTLIKSAREKETGATKYAEGERSPSKESEELYKSKEKGKPQKPKYVEQPSARKEIEFEHDSDRDKPFDSPKQEVFQEMISPGRIAEESKFRKPTARAREMIATEGVSPTEQPSEIRGQQEGVSGSEEFEGMHSSKRSTDTLGRRIKGEPEEEKQETYSKELRGIKDTEEEFESYHPKQSQLKQHQEGLSSPSKRQTSGRVIQSRVGISEASIEEQSEDHISPTIQQLKSSEEAKKQLIGRHRKPRETEEIEELSEEQMSPTSQQLKSEEEAQKGVKDRRRKPRGAEGSEELSEEHISPTSKELKSLEEEEKQIKDRRRKPRDVGEHELLSEEYESPTSQRLRSSEEAQKGIKVGQRQPAGVDEFEEEHEEHVSPTSQQLKSAEEAKKQISERTRKPRGTGELEGAAEERKLAAAQQLESPEEAEERIKGTGRQPRRIDEFEEQHEEHVSPTSQQLKSTEESQKQISERSRKPIGVGEFEEIAEEQKSPTSQQIKSSVEAQKEIKAGGRKPRGTDEFEIEHEEHISPTSQQLKSAEEAQKQISERRRKPRGAEGIEEQYEDSFEFREDQQRLEEGKEQPERIRDRYKDQPERKQIPEQPSGVPSVYQHPGQPAEVGREKQIKQDIKNVRDYPEGYEEYPYGEEEEKAMEHEGEIPHREGEERQKEITTPLFKPISGEPSPTKVPGKPTQLPKELTKEEMQGYEKGTLPGREGRFAEGEGEFEEGAHPEGYYRETVPGERVTQDIRGKHVRHPDEFDTSKESSIKRRYDETYGTEEFETPEERQILQREQPGRQPQEFEGEEEFSNVPNRESMSLQQRQLAAKKHADAIRAQKERAGRGRGEFEDSKQRSPTSQIQSKTLAAEDFEDEEELEREYRLHPERFQHTGPSFLESAEATHSRDSIQKPQVSHIRHYSEQIRSGEEEPEGRGKVSTRIKGERDATRRTGDEASFEYEGHEPSRHTDNIFYDTKNLEIEGEEDFESPRDSRRFTRNMQEGEKTGKFGGRGQQYHFGESSSGRTQEFLAGKDERDNYIKRKAQENRKQRLKKYLSGEPKLSDEGEIVRGSNIPHKQEGYLEGGDKERRKREAQLQREIERQQHTGMRAAHDKSLHDQPFEGKESRIESREQTFEHEDRPRGKILQEYVSTKGDLYSAGQYRMQDDSFHEINQINDRIPDYDEIMDDMRRRDHKSSLDLGGPEMNRFRQDVRRKSAYEQEIDGNMHKTKPHMADRIINSQSVHQLSKESEYRGLPDKYSQSEFKHRKYTDDLIDGQYDPANYLYRDHYDETGSTLEMEYSLLDPTEPLILDHGIMKFHPGFSINYVSKWVQVTKTVIRFYKNYYHSVCSFRRPLAVIPLSAVGAIKNFKLIPKISNATRILQRGKNPYDQNQFEIVLKEDYEAIYDLNKRKKEVEDLRYELDLIQKLDYQNRLTRKYKRYRKECRLSKSPPPTFKMFMENQQDDLKKLSRSHPRLSVYSKLYEDDVSRLGPKTNRSHGNFKDHSVISRGRQSRIEASGDRSAISIDEQYIHSSCSRSRSRKRKDRNGYHNGISKSSKKKRCKTPFDTTLIVDGHLMPIRVNKKEREGSSFRPIVKKKKARVQWSKRETDWFKFERRFILATKTKKEKRKWMKVLRELLPK